MSAKAVNAKTDNVKTQAIDALAYRPYIAAHEQVLYDHRDRRAPPPLQYGTAARSRVNKIRAAGSAAFFS
jgi:hypothetical protein